MNVDVDAALVERYIFDLARHGAHGETGVWRTVYSPEWVAAQEEVGDWLRDAGLEVRQDASATSGAGSRAPRAGRPSSPGRTSTRRIPAAATTGRSA